MTDDAPTNWIGQAQTYGQSYVSPVVLGQVMSSNDAAFSVFWDQGTARTDPPIASTLRTGKTVCEDTNTARAAETVGFVVIESGHGTIGGVEYEAALGADTVAGVTNAPPYAYTFNTPFATAPTVAVTTMAVKAARVRLAALAGGGIQTLSPEEARALVGRPDEKLRRSRLVGGGS